MIQIFTDTSANLPASYIQKYALRVIPLTYLIGGVEAHQDPTVDCDDRHDQHRRFSRAAA